MKRPSSYTVTGIEETRFPIFWANFKVTVKLNNGKVHTFHVGTSMTGYDTTFKCELKQDIDAKVRRIISETYPTREIPELTGKDKIVHGLQGQTIQLSKGS